MKRIVMICSAAIVASVMILNATGFCYNKLRYLTSEEFYEAAIFNQADRIADLAGKRGIEDIHAFIRSHPKCCSIEIGSTFENSFLSNLVGFKIIIVRTTYALSKADTDRFPKEGNFYEAYVEVSPCGKTFHAHGMRLNELPS